MKKIVYGFALLISLSISAWLIYYRIAPHIKVYEPTITQTIVPAAALNDTEVEQIKVFDTASENDKTTSANDGRYEKKFAEHSLHELRNGTSDSFKSFLTGLWYQPSSKKDEKKSIFFDSNENRIVFSINNIEEIFTITSAATKRDGILFSAHNTSISSIKRRVDIELVSVDEIRIRVIDDVARLKIGTASNLDGIYRKMSNITQSETNTAQQIAEIKDVISKNGIGWKTADNYILSFSNSRYIFEYNDHLEEGWYALFTIKGSVIMQCKNDEKKNTFFMVTVDVTPEQKPRLNLTEVFLTLNESIRTSNYQLVFEQMNEES